VNNIELKTSTEVVSFLVLIELEDSINPDPELELKLNKTILN
ncbi:44490_t:CDS:1, partial [Gigaspora margarita]